jgi:hopene-associated glycosyltransferase HpnB
MIAFALAVVSLLAWVYLLGARGGFWRCAERDDVQTARASRAGVDSASTWPAIVVVIPARDEAEVIGDTLAALLNQDYRGDLSIVVVDDESADDTAGICERVATHASAVDRVGVVRAAPAPPGWTGKPWAMHCGVAHAIAWRPSTEYLLLTDADILHARDSVSDIVARARAGRLVLASRMAKLRSTSVAERALIPAFVFFFQMLYPFAWVNAPRTRTAAAAGGCMLVQRGALEAAGGIEAIRGELIDDCALARRLKPQGPISIALSRRVESVRAYRSFSMLRRMISRCAFSELRLSWVRLVLAMAAMLIVFVAPPLIAAFGSGAAALVAVFAWVAMALAFQPTLRLYDRSPAWGLALPVIASVYMILAVDSALAHVRGRGGAWKGRVYARAAPP